VATQAQEHGLEITLAPGDITDTLRGLSQGNLSIRARETYNGYVWIKLPEKQGYTGDITVALEEDNTDGETYAKASLSTVSAGPWKKYSFTLLPKKTDRFAKLTFLFGGKGTLLYRSGITPDRRCEGPSARRFRVHDCKTTPFVHALARRQCRAGLPLAMGSQPPRSAADLGK
jgi:hypothetical protein